MLSLFPLYQMVSILCGALSVLARAAAISEDKSLQDLVQAGSLKARYLITTICYANSTPTQAVVKSSAESWKSFPLEWSWQTSFHERISLRAFNSCVACCVSAFSGWEPHEFNLENLRSCDVNFFGVTLFEGPTVAGK